MKDAVQGAVIGGVAAVCASLLSGTYQHFRDWWQRPRLIIEVAKYDGAPNVSEATWHELDFVISRVFARFSVRNAGKTAAANCRVYLTGITEVVSESVLNPRAIYESFQVPWAGHLLEGRNLPKGLVAFADLVTFDKTVPGWRFPEALYKETRDDLSAHSGEFRFAIIATSDNADPTEAVISVTYSGSWSKVRIWKRS